MDYMRAVNAASGHFIIRGKAEMNPLIIKATGPDGRELKWLRGQRLKAFRARLSEYACVDMMVRMGTDEDGFECRFVTALGDMNLN